MRSWTVVASDGLRAELGAIPGVKLRGTYLTATDDVAEVVAKLVGQPGLSAVKTRSLPNVDLRAVCPTAFAHQLDGAALLRRDARRALWWPTGSGKALTLLLAAHDAERAVIVTRAIGRDVYARDMARLAPRQRIAVLLTEGGDTASAKLAVRRADKMLDRYRKAGVEVVAVGNVKAALTAGAQLIVVGWEILASHVEALAAWKPAIVAFDEHHLGKGRGSTRNTKGAKRVDASFRLAESANRVFSATATPVCDRLRDLWAQWRCWDKASAGSGWIWKHRYCAGHPGRYGGLNDSGASCLDELRSRLDHWVDVRSREEIGLNLPPISINVVRMPISTEKAMRGHFPSGTRGIEAAIAYAANLKLDAVCERAAESLICGEKVILTGNRLAWLPRAVATVERLLKKSPMTRRNLWLKVVSGETSVDDRKEAAADFMAASAPALLVATSASISEAIDLQDADRLIVAALPWTPRDWIQLRGRVHRPGQKRPVTVDAYVAEGTIDTEIESLLLDKTDVIIESGSAVESMDFGGSRRSESEISARLMSWLAEAETEVQREAEARA